jgi:hypothetical protein
MRWARALLVGALVVGGLGALAVRKRRRVDVRMDEPSVVEEGGALARALHARQLGGGTAVPRFTAPVLVRARGVPDELDDDQRRQLDTFDASVRRQATALLGINEAEIAQVDAIDQRFAAARARLEAQVDPSRGTLASGTTRLLAINENEALSALEEVLGERRARRLREAEHDAGIALWKEMFGHAPSAARAIAWRRVVVKQVPLPSGAEENSQQP